LTSVRPAGLTLVVLDEARAPQVPIARLYYYEEVAPLASSIGDQVSIERSGWTVPELTICKRIQDPVRKLAWEDCSRLMEHRLLGPAEEGT
jgi:hypothetical protein